MERKKSESSLIFHLDLKKIEVKNYYSTVLWMPSGVYSSHPVLLLTSSWEPLSKENFIHHPYITLIDFSMISSICEALHYMPKSTISSRHGCFKKTLAHLSIHSGKFTFFCLIEKFSKRKRAVIKRKKS